MTPLWIVMLSCGAPPGTSESREGVTPAENPTRSEAAIEDLGFPVGSFPSMSWTFDDVTGDGTDDLLVSDYWSTSLRIFASPVLGYSTWELEVVPITGYRAPYLNPPAAAVGDFDGDGSPDVLANLESVGAGTGSRFDAEGQVLLLRGPFGPTRTPSQQEVGELAWEAWRTSFATVGDLDGDGFDEFVVSWADGSVFLASLAQDGPYAFEHALARAFRPPHHQAAYRVVQEVGDVDGDGLVDVLVVDEELERAFVVPTAEWQGGRELRAMSGVLTGSTRFAGGGDVDGDGAADLVVSRRSVACLLVDVPVSGSLDVGELENCWPTPGGSVLLGAVIPDLDDDGHDEVALSFQTEGTDVRTYVLSGARALQGGGLSHAMLVVEGVGDPRVANVTGPRASDLVLSSADGSVWVIPEATLRAELP